MATQSRTEKLSHALHRKSTVPDGVIGPTPAVSLTVAVQIVELLTGTVDGVQLKLVLVDRLVGPGW